MIEPSGKSLKWTLVGLALVALISVGLAWLFVQLWTQHLAEQEIRYFRDQGVGRALAIKTELDRRFQVQLSREKLRPHAQWTIPFPVVFAEMEGDITNSSALAANEISLLGARRPKSARGPGKLDSAAIYTIGESFAPYPAETESQGELKIAVQKRDGATLVFVWGPIALPTGAQDDLRDLGFGFRCVLRYQSLPSVGETGGTYATLLACSYLVMLWLVVIVVYYLERRRLVLQMQSQERSIRLTAMAQVAEGIAHEVRNPLNGISLNVQYLQKMQEKGVSASTEDYIRVYGELTKIKNVIDDFVSFSRLEDIELESLFLDELIDDVLGGLSPLVKDVGAEIARSDLRETEFRGDRAKLGQAFKAVLRNSLEALAVEEGARALGLRLDSDRALVRCQIENSGQAIPPEVLKSMFDPFFTTRSSAMGLGLTLAKTIFEAHGGRVVATVPPGGGCRLDIELPRRF